MNTTYTITEALAELKTLDKRIDSAKDFVLKYGLRQGTIVDPLAEEGGSDKLVPAKLQSIQDLLQRKVAIRSAVNAANAATRVEIAGTNRSVAEWIIWRREVLKQEQSVFQQLQNRVIEVRKAAADKGIAFRDDSSQPSKPTEVGCFIREASIQKHLEDMQEMDGTLDGKLSLINATTTVTV